MRSVVPKKAANSKTATPKWTFLTNHAHLLLCLAADPEMRMRDVAANVGITERAALRIVAELEDAQYLKRRRNGRRNRYELRPGLFLRHPIEGHRTIGELVEFVVGSAARRSTDRRPRKGVYLDGSASAVALRTL